MQYPGVMLFDFLQKTLLKDSRMEGKLWENARFILADVPLNPSVARKLMPFGMKLAEPASGVLFIADYTKTSFTIPYQEAALLVRVRTLFGEGLHCCWMVVNDDTALIYGRELLGYPKKLADITFEETSERISASVTRRGVRVMAMEAERGPAQSSPAPVFDIKTFNAGGMGQYFLCNPVWLLRPVEEIHESYEATVSLSLEEAEFDPIARLVAGAPTSGRIAVTDILGTRYMCPVGIAGPRWFPRTFNMRYR